MTEFWYFIASIFEDLLFLPFDWLREWQDSTWWGANLLNFGFVLIAAMAFLYWLKQLDSFENEDHHDYSKS
jgi:hypothetical protein